VNGWEGGVDTPRDRDGVPQGRSRRPDGGAGGRRQDDPASQWLVDLLQVEASHHRPDRERILALMAERERAESATSASSATVSHPGRLRRRGRSLQDARRPGGQGWRDDGRRTDGAERQASPSRRRVGWPLVVASSAVLTMATVAGASVLVPSAGPGTGPAATATATGSHTLGPAATITQPPAPRGSAVSTAPATSSPSTTTGNGPTSTPGGPGRPERALEGAVTIGVMPTGDGTQLSLPRSVQDLDWIAVGSRADGELVRAEHASRKLGTVTVSGHGSLVAPGPYRISWNGGVPEPSQTLDTTWQSITAVDGRLRVTVPLQGDQFTVKLFMGTVSTTGQVSVSAPGSTDTVTALVQPCERAVCSDVVSVVVDSSRLPGGGKSGDLVIELGMPGDGGSLGLAAVILGPLP
jgi:hypothetical protein